MGIWDIEITTNWVVVSIAIVVYRALELSRKRRRIVRG